MEDNNEVVVNEKLSDKITVEYILEQIEALRTDNAYLSEVIEDMSKIDNITFPQNCGDINFVTKAEGWRDIVIARETTNQKMIHFYEKVYDDIKPKSSDDNVKQFILELVRNTQPGTEQPDYASILAYIK